MTSGIDKRYADLTGKAVVVAGESAHLGAVVRVLAANGMLIAVAAPDRQAVADAVHVAEGLGATVMGVTTDPSTRQAWERLRPQVEQRLGPIDVAVAIGPARLRAATAAAVLPDMAARRRGVIIDVDDALDGVSALGDALRHYGLRVGAATDDQIADLVANCASDTMTEPVRTFEPRAAGRPT